MNSVNVSLILTLGAPSRICSRQHFILVNVWTEMPIREISICQCQYCNFHPWSKKLSKMSIKDVFLKCQNANDNTVTFMHDRKIYRNLYESHFFLKRQYANDKTLTFMHDRKNYRKYCSWHFFKANVNMEMSSYSHPWSKKKKKNHRKYCSPDMFLKCQHGSVSMKMSVCKMEYENWHTGTFMHDRNNQKKQLQYWQISTKKDNWNCVCKILCFATNALKNTSVYISRAQ